MDTRTKKQKTGDLGEDIAEKFLVKRGFSVIDRNYRRKWGEIDIIAIRNESSRGDSRGKVLHFVEVKAGKVSGETKHRPEEHVTKGKLERLYRAIATYLEDKNVSDETEWVIDVIAIDLNIEAKEARLRFLENIVAE